MSDPRKITERVFQQEVRKAALLNGWRFYHTYRSDKSDPGFPDCVMVHPKHQMTIFAELKSEKGKTTTEQAAWVVDLIAAGQYCFIWRPSDMDTIWEILTQGSLRYGSGRDRRLETAKNAKLGHL